MIYGCPADLGQKRKCGTFESPEELFAHFEQCHMPQSVPRGLRRPRRILLWAAQMGHEAVIQLLFLKKDPDVEVRDFDLMTPLSLAAREGRNTVVPLLLEKGAKLESRDKESKTPLAWAACRGHNTIVRLLLEKGADLESLDIDLRTPLALAADGGHQNVVSSLLQSGANLKTRDKRSMTPLLLAVRSWGREGLVRLLLDNGADPKVRDDTGKSPLDYARERNNSAVAKLLEKREKSAVDKLQEATRSAWGWSWRVVPDLLRK